MVEFRKDCFHIKMQGKNTKLNNHKKKANLEISKEMYVANSEFIEKNVLNLLKKNNSSGKK